MTRRKLKLNDGKTESIVIRGNLRNASVANFGEMSFGNTQLVPCESAKNLGVVLDSSLTFRSHIDSIVKTANFHILYMIKDFVYSILFNSIYRKFRCTRRPFSPQNWGSSYITVTKG